MIYEYPEEFVVPVIYSEELKENPMYREWELKYLQMENVIEPYKKMKEYEMLPKDECETFYISNIGKNSMSFSDFDEEECYQDDYIKDILKEIDNEYAKSETLCI
jgi:hypothetical protein